MHTTRIALLLSSAIGINGCFFVWTKSLVFGQPHAVLGVQYAEGPLTIICFLCIAGVALLNFKKRFENSLIKPVAFFSAAVLMITAYKMYAIETKAVKI